MHSILLTLAITIFLPSTLVFAAMNPPAKPTKQMRESLVEGSTITGDCATRGGVQLVDFSDDMVALLYESFKGAVGANKSPVLPDSVPSYEENERQAGTDTLECVFMGRTMTAIMHPIRTFWYGERCQTPPPQDSSNASK